MAAKMVSEHETDPQLRAIWEAAQAFRRMAELQMRGAVSRDGATILEPQARHVVLSALVVAAAVLADQHGMREGAADYLDAYARMLRDKAQPITLSVEGEG